jgi:urocanate hydratase
MDKGDAMTHQVIPHDRTLHRWIHPAAYEIAVGLVGLFTIAAWLAFDHRNDTELPLAMITVFFVISASVLAIISRLWRKRGPVSAAYRETGTLRHWMSGEFAVWGSRIRGSEALVDMLLPAAAAAFGMVAIGAVFALSGSW